ncbi:restriction endonuclease subunit S [Endozoicomonas sp. ALD040]|uniref:restriction endonuclease subunit S n=1 Tax=Endozoicomonas sp. ALD040 TaxID=3403079 RepID=UPI003BB10DAB
MGGNSLERKKYVAYPEYKDSTEEWLGKVPEHWEVIQIKRLSPVKRGASPRPIDDPKYFDEVGEYAWTRIADVTASDVYLTKAPQRLSDLGSSLSVKLEPESLFLSIAGTVGKPCITGMKACIHDGFVYFPELKIPSKFLFYVFAGEQAYKGLGKFGTQLNLNTDTVGGIKIGCTTNEELNQIVTFLDHETAKIDTLIEEQQSLIRLLKEKRQAVISHAVTKGLNPDAPMKDSGAEWFTELPGHWKAGKLGYFSKITNGATPSRENSAYWKDGTIGWLNSSKVNDVYIDKADQFITPLALSQTSVQEVVEKDLVIAITGEGQTRGRVAICLTNATINQHLAAISITNPNLNHEFLFYYLTSQYERIRYESSGAGSTKGAITCGDIVSYPLPIPSIDEQLEIVEYISNKLEKFDLLLQLAIEQIEFLKERRTALISAAVTGKIDVRDWVAPP